jgi:hypothetical protein
MERPVSLRHLLKMALKRGALVAAANWPVALIQAAADALFKVLIAAPLVGGIILTTMVIGADIDEQATDWRVLLTQIIASLVVHRMVLVAFVLSVTLVVIGGSLFVFLIKGGTMGVLVRGERQAPAVENDPLQFKSLTLASSFSIELFVDSARSLFRRYAHLGFMLMTVYLLSAAAFMGLLLWESPISATIGSTTLITVAFVLWVTLVNLVYLLIQVVIAADDCSVASAARRVAVFVRQERRVLAGIFIVVLAILALATAASVIAFTGLGLILLIPFVWLAAIPLQLVAFVLRALVFQYIDMTSIGAYLKLYRAHSSRLAADGISGEPLAAWPPPADLTNG